MGSPYDHLPDRAFWRTGVAGQPPAAVAELYAPKFAITPEMRIMTAGSCFAQHVHRNLVARDWNVIDTETPAGDFPREALARFGYGLYSARYGNVYTTRQMLQLVHEAFGEAAPADPVWERDGRFFDAQRPNVEPEGLSSPELVREARAAHLAAVRAALLQTDLFVFTLGLTECWLHRATGTVYPTAPGTIAGCYDPATHVFHALTVAEILADLSALRDLMRSFNPAAKMLLTVSPVPLTATASGGHVLAATVMSKAVLRAAAGEFSAAHADVDYFPSYEVITNPAARSGFYRPNLRSVAEEGVEAAMALFFAAHAGAEPPAPRAPVAEEDGDDAVICEEMLIEARRK